MRRSVMSGCRFEYSLLARDKHQLYGVCVPESHTSMSVSQQAGARPAVTL